MTHLILVCTAILGLSETARNTPPPTAPRTVVAVPFAGPGDTQWIGDGLAHAINLRIFAQPTLNGLSLRQIRAAAQNTGQKFESSNDAAMVANLRRQLGADILLVGDYALEGGDLRLNVSILNGTDKETVKTLNGSVAELIGLEAQLAAALAKMLGAKSPDVTPGAFGTRSVDAWREVTLGLEILSYQSLSPQFVGDKDSATLTDTQLRDAARHFEKATEIDPNYGEAWAGRGMSAALANDFEPARTYLQRSTALLGEHQPTAVFATYLMRLRQGREDAAAEVLEAAVARHPGFLQARAYLGELAFQRGKYADAVSHYSNALALAPNQPWLLAERGYAKSKLDDHEGAIRDSLAANELLPNAPELLVALASRYIDANKLVGAEDSLLRAQEIAPEQGRVHVRLCYVHVLRRNDEAAIPLCEKGLSLSVGPGGKRDRAYAHLNLAQLQGRASKLDAAFDHLQQAKALGVSRFSAFEIDPGLAAMREDPRYAELVK